VNINFVSDTYPLCCVAELCSELIQMEEWFAQSNISFPYTIGVALRCLPDEIGRKTFRRFDKIDNDLTLDITVSHEKYQLLSKNEQREKLGILLFDYIAASVKKYKEASKKEQDELLLAIKTWMLSNNWLDGNIKKAREMINADMDLFAVSQEIELSFEEVEYIYLKMNGYESNAVHNDNYKNAKYNNNY
jgi:hypothetical protein